MDKILVIPHHPGLNRIRIRLIEMARFLAAYYTVYLLDWQYAQRPVLSQRIWAGVKDLTQRFECSQWGEIRLLRLPLLHRPLSLAYRVNSRAIRRVLKREGIDTVLNGSVSMFTAGPRHPFRYMFDLADLLAPETDSRAGAFVYRRMTEELKFSDGVTVCSRGLKEYVAGRFDTEAFFVPNGADITALESVPDEKVRELRYRLGLTGKWVFGYLGNIGPWVNVEMAVAAFRAMQAEIPGAVLLWIGSGPDLETLKKKYSSRSVIFAGPTDTPELYLKALDVGIIPTRKSAFQDMAFHLKAVEYTAAGKFVISTPLAETERMGLPNIMLVPEDVGRWADAFRASKNWQWKREWADVGREYDWRVIAGKMHEAIENAGSADR